MNTIFSVEQVKALCGNIFPGDRNWSWDQVERFELEDGVFQPYAGNTILPMPGIEVTTNVYAPSWERQSNPTNPS